MRPFTIAAFAAAVNAFPAPYGNNHDAAPAAVTVTDYTDVYTTVYEDEPAEPAAPTTSVAAATTYKNEDWKPKTTPDAPVVVVSETPVHEAPAATTPVVSSAPVPEAPATTPVVTPVVSPAPAPASSSPAVSAAAKAPNDYAQKCVDHHNAHRLNHSVDAIAWDDALAATALKIAKSCIYAHDTKMDGGGYGQNIAAGCPASNISSVITELFYNNEVGNFASLYGQATPSNINDEAAFDGYGHFTQIVWKGTTKVGCATYHCDGGLANTGGNVSPDFTVCNYQSPGNYIGQFAKNVSPPGKFPIIHWNTGLKFQ
ncbi:putative effector 14 [Venturia nashicola]|uniref:Putative effector 14 n=1 Tax=Venturia nashicola TaxID=86259 RepID=A0A4Z1PCP0_9PEZI|nr:putative effector 14 [Venturia nashicola]TLD32105.1 putative effector 14 [Venturia nashicola]